MQHLVYLHGFLSSPESQKAQQTLSFAKKHFPSLNVHIPQLPGDINKAVRVIDGLVSTLPIDQTGFIGSSMGGFLATYLLEKYSPATTNSSSDNTLHNTLPKAVLVNPAVEPFNLLGNYLGQHINPYTNETFYVTTQHITMLKRLYVNKLRMQNRYKVLLQTGDETLPYALAANKYEGASTVIEQGGNHSFVNYSQHLSSIFAFLFR